MPRLLNPQHEFFSRAYVNSPFAGNLVDAYEAAGYARDRGNAVRLSRQPDVAARIAELREADRAVERHAVREALAEEGIDRASLVRCYSAMMRANPLDYYTVEADGSTRAHLERLDRNKGTAVREIAIGAAKSGKPTLRLAFYDKHKAMLQLAKLIEFSEDISVPQRTALTDEQERERVVATVRDYAERAEDDDVATIMQEALAAARARYPDGNLTTFERIMRDVRREEKARAEQAKAAQAAAAQNAAAQAAIAALLPADAADGGDIHDSKCCHGEAATVARLEQSESRDGACNSAPDVAALDRSEGTENRAPSWPGIAVRRTASLRSPASRPSTPCLMAMPNEDVDPRDVDEASLPASGPQEAARGDVMVKAATG